MASKDKNLQEKKQGKIHGTKKSDATPFAITVLQQVSYGYENWMSHATALTYWLPATIYVHNFSFSIILQRFSIWLLGMVE